jgi:hypothetical protein
LALGDYRGGWEDYEWRRRAALRSKPSEFAQPLWLGQSALSGKTILLHAEQGLGDTLQFVRYAPLVAQLGARVMLQVQAPLKRLLAGMEGVSAVYSIGEALPGFDCHCPMMSLPHALGTELADIPAATPYLRADPADAGRWRARLTKGAPNVGLVWAGAAREHDVRANRVDRRRSLSLAQLAPLSGAGVRFVSLQKGPPGKEARQPPPAMEVLDRPASSTTSPTLRRWSRRWTLSSQSTRRSRISPARLASRCGSCRASTVAGAGSSTATTAPGIRRRGSSANARRRLGHGHRARCAGTVGLGRIDGNAASTTRRRAKKKPAGRKIAGKGDRVSKAVRGSIASMNACSDT